MRLCTLRIGIRFSERSRAFVLLVGRPRSFSMTYVVLKGYLYDPIDCVRPGEVSVQVRDGLAAPGNRRSIDSFMHAPLGSGDIARLVELRSCNWVDCDYGLDV
ncbi:hypothetical protein IFM89_020919 [Coptis chinensis]|uniref:Uncharacterized protein n=1 Tax=Coptis chinensis TaxID=261450 RepID=A0A835M9I1_9MAGN|nr:hypothetical protein IFM89_020919 [Coptis chinensis]